VIKRATWLTVGAALGAGGTLWARRRLQLLSERARSGEIAGDLSVILERGAHRAARRVRNAVEGGRDDARLREERLWRELEVRTHAR
jgi:hypothetical protein